MWTFRIDSKHLLQYADPTNEKWKYFIRLNFFSWKAIQFSKKQKCFFFRFSMVGLEMRPTWKPTNRLMASDNGIISVRQGPALPCAPWGRNPTWLPASHQPSLCPNHSAHLSQSWHTCFRYNCAKWAKQTVIATVSFHMYVQELMQYVYKALSIYKSNRCKSKNYPKLSQKR